jgi:hypothetical protein
VWVKLLYREKTVLIIALKIIKKRALISISKMIKCGHLMKRNRAILGRNSTRDNQMQIALNNATNDGGQPLLLSPIKIQSLFKLFCPCLKNPSN